MNDRRFFRKLPTVLIIVAVITPSLKAERPTFTHDVVYGHKDGLAMTFDVITPKKQNGIGVLFMVSGGWYSRWFPAELAIRDGARLKNGFERLTMRGFTVFLIRHGSAPRYKVPDAVADVRRAVRYIRLNAKKYGIDPDRLGAMGSSAGGHLSLMLGTTADKGQPKAIDPVKQMGNRVAAVVAYFPPTDLRDIVGPSKPFPALDFDPKLAESVSPLLHVSEDDAPSLMIHGDKDRLVKLSHSENIKQAFDEKKVENNLIVIEGAGHGFRGDHEQQAIKAMVDWFEKHLLNTDANKKDTKLQKTDTKKDDAKESK